MQLYNHPQKFKRYIHALVDAVCFRGDGGRAAIIAGGAVRDAILGIEPRDLDVWCWQHQSRPLVEALLFQGCVIEGEYPSYEGDDAEDRGIYHVTKLTTPDGDEIDIIQVSEALYQFGIPDQQQLIDAVLNGFDFDVNQAAVTLEPAFVVHDTKALAALANRRAGAQRKIIPSRAAKMIDKGFAVFDQEGKPYGLPDCPR